jgi:putative flippase GtrA
MKRDPVLSGESAVRRPLGERSAVLRHWGGFVLAGSIAFVVDSGVLMLLSQGLGMPALVARILAISLAMIVSWLINRTITFPTSAAPSVAEFARFAAVAWSAAAINYLVFAGLVMSLPKIHPVAAVAIASLVAMVGSYAGMRFGVFRRPMA